MLLSNASINILPRRSDEILLSNSRGSLNVRIPSFPFESELSFHFFFLLYILPRRKQETQHQHYAYAAFLYSYSILLSLGVVKITSPE